MSLFVFICPSNVLVLPLFCPGLAIESAQNPFDVLAMTFFTQKAFGRRFDRLMKTNILWINDNKVVCFAKI